jgi:hypothetical protein
MVVRRHGIALKYGETRMRFFGTGVDCALASVANMHTMTNSHSADIPSLE